MSREGLRVVLGSYSNLNSRRTWLRIFSDFDYGNHLVVNPRDFNEQNISKNFDIFPECLPSD